MGNSRAGETATMNSDPPSAKVETDGAKTATTGTRGQANATHYAPRACDAAKGRADEASSE